MNLISKTTWKRSPTAKSYIFRYDDDSIVIRTLWLTDKRMRGTKLLTKKFGKYLHHHISQRFSKETLFFMGQLLEQKENPDGIIYQTANMIKQ